MVLLAGYFPSKVEKAGKVVRAIAILAHPIPNTDNAASAQIILPQRQTGRKNDIYVFCCSTSHNVCAPDKWLAFVSTIVETTDPERELAQGVGQGSSWVSEHTRENERVKLTLAPCSLHASADKTQRTQSMNVMIRCCTQLRRPGDAVQRSEACQIALLTRAETHSSGPAPRINIHPGVLIHGLSLHAGLALLGPIEEKFVEVTDLYVPKEDGTKDMAYISRGECCVHTQRWLLRTLRPLQC